MLLLASILGEVKPPVASKEEIDAAGGISIVGENITLEQERCLVCLSDYELGEEIRTLSGCGHLFHKQCIDQVIPLRSPEQTPRTNPLRSIPPPNTTPILSPVFSPRISDRCRWLKLLALLTF